MFDLRSELLEASAEQAEVWLGELSQELGGADYRHAHRVLRAVLHAIRDGLSVEQAAAVGGPLPTLIRGLYYEDWEPARTPPALGDLDSFLTQVAEDAQLANAADAAQVTGAVVRVLLRHTSASAGEGSLSILPAKLGFLLEL
jgi:uncharacterized protein (DUF2267 family)